ncbi:MAG: DUF2490 domain-containing protein [Robiginitalea sp.]|jgi:hypothetical protein
MMQKYAFTLCSFFLLVVSAGAQESDTEIWVNYSLKVPTTEKVSYGGDMGYRRIIKQGSARQYLIRPTLTYSFNEIFAVAGAVAWFRTYSDNTPNLNELRIQQDFNVRWPDLGFARLFFRARLEQRFFFYKNLPDDFDLRARFLGGAQTKDLTFLGERRPIYFKSLFEGFWTVTAEKASEFLINNTRFHLAFGHRLSKAWRYEIHYIHQSSRFITTEGSKVRQDIFRLRVFHTLFENKSIRSEMVDPEIE